jgi:DinB superfamily
MLPCAKPRNKSSCCELAGRLCYSTEVIKIRKARGQQGEGEYVNKTEVVIAALERAPHIVIPLVQEVPEPILKRRPRPGKWSAHEHACHLALVHPRMSTRLDLMLTDPSPRIKPYLPHLDEEDGAMLKLDLDVAMEHFSNDRRQLVERLHTLSAEEWLRTAEHGEYTHYSVFIMFRHLAMHDMFHAYRIEELLLKNDWE